MIRKIIIVILINNINIRKKYATAYYMLNFIANKHVITGYVVHPVGIIDELGSFVNAVEYFIRMDLTKMLEKFMRETKIYNTYNNIENRRLVNHQQFSWNWTYKYFHSIY